ncbi:unnamed protein product [Brassica rapa]|uniref:Uncharacterized protein n=1 Tax=Brassica campestris TaxID=3711 RepID=A0A8D9GYP0_BRACM|nr:unnamed protein product [Brassica rapa]
MRQRVLSQPTKLGWCHWSQHSTKNCYHTCISYTKLALQDRVLDIAYKSVLNSDLRVGFPVSECLTLVVEVGLKCCEESPASEHGIRVNVCQGEVLSSQMRSQKLKSFCFFSN